jgi:hypothetical protein
MNAHKTRSKTTSRYKGVALFRTLKDGTKKYRVRICLDGNNRTIGFFRDETGAALAYNAAARQYFGKYAHLNEVSVPFPCRADLGQTKKPSIDKGLRA